MPTDTSVKFLHSGMTGAPVLSGTAAALIALLDACLKDGFGAVTLDSLTIAGGVGTLVRGAGLPFEPGAVMLIAGASVSGGSVNGERKAIATSGTTATFDATGLADQTATGTISARLAPLGWAKTYAGTNLAAYKPSDITATGCMLRVDDTAATYARVRAYGTMSDVNTGTLLTPQDSQVSGGLYWPKSNAADTTARPWVLVGDGRMFYLMVAYSGTTSTAYSLNHVFGDINAVKSPDAYACVLNGFSSNVFGTNGANAGFDFDHGDSTLAGSALFAVSSWTAYGASVAMRKSFPMIAGATGNKSGAAGLPFPNQPDGGVYLAPVYLVESVAVANRGMAPGFYCSPQQIGPSVFNNKDYLSGVSGYAGKTFRIVNSNVGCFAFDTTGPWR